jgi:4-hydroxybenzoate polyprenyltransferase
MKSEPTSTKKKPKQTKKNVKKDANFKSKHSTNDKTIQKIQTFKRRNITKSQKVKSLLFDLTRISEWWLISFGFILFAFVPYIYRLHNGMKLAYLYELFFTSPLYLTIIIVFAAQMFLFAANDYYDRHVDALDPKKRKRNPICDGRVSSNEAIALLVATAAISLIVSLIFNFLAFLFTAFALFVFYFYTAEPLRFKKRVGLDVISHAIFINTFPFLVAMLTLWDFHFEAIFLLSVLIFRSATAQILQEIRDYDVDKKVERNTVIVLGRKNAAWLVFVFFIIVTASTLIFMITYQLYGFGLRPFFILIFSICILYSPTFYKLLITKNYSSFIDSLWMGQGRTNKRLVALYGVAFGIWLFIVIFFLL